MKSSTSSTITFRQAVPQEAESLSHLALRSKSHWGYSDEFLFLCKDELTYSAAQITTSPAFVVAETHGVVVGFIALDHVKDGEIELEALFVEPEHIGRGIGQALMNRAKEVACALGAKSLIIQGDPHAESFYRMAGGEFVGTRESESIPGRMLPVFQVRLEASSGS